MRHLEAHDAITCRFLLKVYCKVGYHIWEKSNFGAGICPDQNMLKFIFGKVINLMDSVDLEAGEWLGGECNNGRPILRDTVLITLLACASIFDTKHASEMVETRFQRYFNNSKEVVTNFMAQDDHLMALGIATLSLKNFYHGRSILCFHEISTFVLMTTSFDNTIILDWIENNVSCLAFCIRFLKEIGGSATSTKEWDGYLAALHDKIKEGVFIPKSNNGRWVTEPRTSSNDIIMKVKSMKSSKGKIEQIRCRASESKHIFVEEPDTLNYKDDDYDDLLVRIYLCFFALRSDIMEPKRSSKIPFDPQYLNKLINSFGEQVQSLRQ
ncbi:unnamed protein product [Auanema sp. JU1783]|nr:unnamed protein product [Auanema sp. JU1783]